jgi:hypothetical protein
MQYSAGGDGLSQEACPEGPADIFFGRWRRKAERDSPGDEPGGGLWEGNALKG